MRAGTTSALMDPTETILLEISTQLHPEQLINYLGNLYEEAKETQHPVAETGKGISLLNLQISFLCHEAMENHSKRVRAKQPDQVWYSHAISLKYDF